jgi:hypothetical protein
VLLDRDFGLLGELLWVSRKTDWRAHLVALDATLHPQVDAALSIAASHVPSGAVGLQSVQTPRRHPRLEGSMRM